MIPLQNSKPPPLVVDFNNKKEKNIKIQNDKNDNIEDWEELTPTKEQRRSLFLKRKRSRYRKNKRDRTLHQQSVFVSQPFKEELVKVVTLQAFSKLDPQGLFKGVRAKIDTIKEVNHVVEQLDKVKENLKYDGTLAADFIPNLLCRIEDLTMLLAGLSSAQNFTSVFTTLFFYLRTHYKESISTKLYAWIKEAMMKNIAETSTDPFGGGSLRSKLDHQGIYDDLKSTIIGYDTLSGIETFRGLLTDWKRFRACALGDNVANVVNILVSVGFFPDLLDNPIKLGVFEVFKAKVWDIQKNAGSFTDMCADTLDFFLSRAHHAISTGDPSVLLYGGQEERQYETEYTLLTSCFPAIEAGKLDELHKYCVDVKDESDFDLRLQILISSTVNMIKNENSPPRKMVLAGYLSRLRTTAVALTLSQKNSCVREKPYGMLVNGASSVGKTMVVNILMKTALACNGFANDKEFVVTIKDNENFDTDQQPFHTGWIFDDYGNTKAEHYSEAPTRLLIDVLNNIPRSLRKADIESKGNKMMQPKVVGLTTNIKTLHADKFSVEPVSILRRFDVVMDVYLRPEFVHPVHGGVDGSKMVGWCPDAWEIDIQRVVIVRKTLENGLTQDKYKFDTILARASIYEVRDYVKKNSNIHFAHQRSFVKSVEKMYDTTFCDHGDPANECNICVPCVQDSPFLEDCFEDYSISDGEEEAELAHQVEFFAEHGVLPGEYTDEEIRFSEAVTAQEEVEEAEIQSILSGADSEYSAYTTYSGFCGRKTYGDYKCNRTQAMKHTTRLRPDSEKRLRAVLDEKKARVNKLETQGVFDLKGDEPEYDVVPMRGLFHAHDAREEHLDALCRFKDDEGGEWETLEAANKPLLDNILNITIVACGGVASILVLCGLVKLYRGLSVATQGSTVSTPVVIESDRPNPWKIVQPVAIPKSLASANVTTDELVAYVSKHAAWATFTYVDGDGLTHQGGCNAIPMQGNVWVVPAHMLKKSKDLTMDIRRVSADTIGYRFSQTIDPSCWVELPNDLALVRLTSGGSVADLSKFLAEGDFALTDKLFCEVVHRTEQCLITKDTIKIDERKTFKTDIEFEGVSYQHARPTFAGLCCATLITHQRRPCILGFHVAGRTGSNYGVAALLTRGDVLKGLSDLDTKMSLTAHSESDMPTSKYDIDFTPTPVIHPKHCINFLTEDEDGEQPALDTYGAHPSGNVKFVSQIKQSPISNSVEKHLNLPRQHGPPQKGPAWVHWQRDLQAMSHPKGGKMKPHLLRKAFDDYRGLVRQYLVDHPEKKELVHPYSKDAVLSGVDGVASVESVDQNTSMGWPINKAKKFFLGPVERKVPGISVVLDFKDPKFWAEVVRMEDELAAGRRIHVVFRANLKDEPVKFTKNKVRVFTGCEFAFTCLVRKYFLPIVRLIQDSEGALECAVGINATSPQWDKFVQRLIKFGRNRMIAGDYRLYDKVITILMMMYCFEIMIDVAIDCGYDDRQITIMRGIASEISNPLYEYDGIFIQMLGSNPSGHPLTVVVNNIVNSLYLRYAYYSMHEKAGDIDVPPFAERVVLSCYGDDNAGGVSEEEELFNHTSLSNELAEVGITYTMADKTAASVPFQTLEQISFLKRGFRYDEEVGMFLAPIEEASIAKSLHNYRKTKGTDVLPEYIASQALKGASREYFQWGREVFEDRTAKLKLVADEVGLNHMTGDFPTWIDLRDDYLGAGIRHPMEKEPLVPNYSLEPYDWYVDTSPLTQQGAYAVLEHNQMDDLWSTNLRDAAKLSHSASVIRLANNNIEEGQGSATAATQSSAVLDKPIETEFSTGNAEKNQNVQFRDDNLGFGDSRGSPFDKIRDDAMIQDATLDEFFHRPVKIFSHQWNVNGYFNFTFDPWTLYWENARVKPRISNYRLLRATMRVKFVINGNAFYYGRVLANYRPLHTEDELTQERALSQVDLVAASQRPHIFLDPCTNQGGELELPFFTQLNVLDIVGQEWRKMGQVTMQSINDLKHANGAVDPITINVFAWAENVSFSVPTQLGPGDISPQGKDEVLGIVSKPASVVAKTASLFTSIPVIAPFARATEIGARAIGSMAALFGYSKPALVPAAPFQPLTKTSMALCDGAEALARLTIDSKNELSIDPAISGIKAKDELAILNIATRESYFTTFSWALPPGKTSEDMLWNCVVDPAIHRQLTTFVGQPPELHFPACCFASLPFQYWKGTMRFRFQVVASGYHKGRLKFVYDPVTTGFDPLTPTLGFAEYNTAYTTIVDIVDTNDFTIDIGWGQTTPFRENAMQLAGPYSSTTRLTYNSLSVPYGNGTLAVYVVNDLTSPDSLIDNDIQINVFVSMLEDFEVAGPTSKWVKNLKTYLPPELAPQGDFGVVPTDPMTIAMMGQESTIDDTMNRIYFGEAIASFRTLLKRYCLHEIMSIENNDFSFPDWLIALKMTRNSFPHETGYVADSNGYGIATSTPFVSEFVMGYTPLVSYLTSAFMGWRGSMRYMWDASFNMDYIISDENGFPTTNSFTVTRLPTDKDYGISDSIAPFGSGTGKFSNISNMLKGAEDATGLDGISRWHTRVNPFHTFEVPYYSNQRFTVARKHTKFTADGTEQKYQVAGQFPMGVSSFSPYVFQSYVAAGEDFNPMFFIGAPIMYYVENLDI